MATKTLGTVTTPKTLDDLAKLTANQADEIELDVANDDDVLVYEGGDWDGRREKASKSRSIDVPEVEVPATDDKTVETKPDATVADGEGSATPDSETAAEATSEGQATTPEATADGEEPAAAESAETPEYKPDFQYQVYGAKKEFPEWAKAAVTSKEAEDNVRTVLQKSEAYDILKPKNDTVIKERDEVRGVLKEQVEHVQRLVELRDKNFPLFLKKMGVPDQVITDYAYKKAAAEKDPEAARAMAQRVEDDSRAYDHGLETQRQAVNQQQDFIKAHVTTRDLVFAQPEVAAFKARMDGVYGDGTFERVFTETGSLAYDRGEGYVHPTETVRRIQQHYGQVLAAAPIPAPAVAPVAPAAVPAPAVKSQVPAQTTAHGVQPGRSMTRTTKPVTIPNVGRGSTVSPTSKRMRSLDDVAKRVDQELGR